MADSQCAGDVLMTAEEKYRQEWINDYIGSDGDLDHEAARNLAARAEAAWEKYCSDGPKDSGDAWEGGFAWNH